MNAGRIFAAAAAIFLSIHAAYAEPTVSRKIESMDLQGADGGVIVRGIGAWGIYCGGAVVYSVYFSPTTVQAYKEMLAMVMMSYLGGKSIRFYGACASAGVYNGTYLIVSE